MPTKGLLVTMAGYPMVPSNFYPDNGLAQLAGSLLAAGHEVIILDYNTPELMDRLYPLRFRAAIGPLLQAKLSNAAAQDALDDLLRLERELDEFRNEEFLRMGEELVLFVRREGIQWVGFKLWNGDGFTGSELMARALKKSLPELPIIAGGSQVDFFAEFLPTMDTAFDYFGVEEGEPTMAAFAEFVDGERAIDQVPNLIIPQKHGGSRRTYTQRVADLNQLPFPVYDASIYPAMGQPGKFLAGVVEESRGCPNFCAFCNHPLKTGHQLRQKTVARVIAEFQDLMQKKQISTFKLGGSTTPGAYLRELSQALIDQNIRLTFCSFGRINDAAYQAEDRSSFELFYRAGCRALFFGVETGSQSILDGELNKGYRTTQSREVLKQCKAAGIYTIISLIYPNPGETAVSREVTLELIRDTRPDSVPVQFPLLLPGSRWWDHPEKFGFHVPDRERYLQTAISYKARMLFPPQFWEDAPYFVDGKPFRQFATETAEMTATIESMGPVTLLSDDAAILALNAGIEPRVFRDTYRRHAVLGDAAGVQSMIDAVNDKLRKQIHPWPLTFNTSSATPYPDNSVLKSLPC